MTITSEILKSVKPESIFDVLNYDIFGAEKDHPSHAEYIYGGNYYEWYYAISKIVQPKTILEVGVRFGYSLYCMSLASDKIEEILGYDIQNYEHLSNNLAHENLKHLPRGNVTLSNINSQELTQLDAHYDLIHIDGDHTFEGKIHDLELVHGHYGVLIIDDYDHHLPVRNGINHYINKYNLQFTYIPSKRGTIIIESGR